MLPIRFATGPQQRGAGRVVHVDGSPIGEATPEDLHLSHWPGNLTPKSLKHDLSTEIAFAFIDLPSAEQTALIKDAEALVLNHYDTDGICALFVLTRPDRARAHRELLNGVALSGDFFAVHSERAYAIDATLRELGEKARDPSGSDPAALKQALVVDALDQLGALLQDESDPGEHGAVKALRADRAALESAAFDDLVYLDFGIWTGASPRSNGETFDPGRHAFFGDGRVDRALLLGRDPAGTTARFVLGTRSFFDVVTRPASPRPDLPALCAQLQGMEPEGSAGEWQHHDPRTASPELWFGEPDLPLYAEHAGPSLRRSAIPLLEIRKAVTDAIRNAWVLPDDDDEADDGEDIFAV